jgi:hypothetical protein
MDKSKKKTKMNLRSLNLTLLPLVIMMTSATPVDGDGGVVRGLAKAKLTTKVS